MAYPPRIRCVMAQPRPTFSLLAPEIRSALHHLDDASAGPHDTGTALLTPQEQSLLAEVPQTLQDAYLSTWAELAMQTAQRPQIPVSLAAELAADISLTACLQLVQVPELPASATQRRAAYLAACIAQEAALRQ